MKWLPLYQSHTFPQDGIRAHPLSKQSFQASAWCYPCLETSAYNQFVVQLCWGWFTFQNWISADLNKLYAEESRFQIGNSGIVTGCMLQHLCCSVGNVFQMKIVIRVDIQCLALVIKIMVIVTPHWYTLKGQRHRVSILEEFFLASILLYSI